METILYRTFRKSGGRHYIFPPSFAARGDEPAAQPLVAPDDSGIEPNFLLPTDPDTPFYENYNYTSYDWDSGNKLVITTTGTEQVYSIADINDPNNRFQTPGLAPTKIDLLPAIVVDEFRVPTNPTNFRFIGLDEKLVRIHHAALGSIDFTVEIVNELVLLNPSITSIPPLPANSQPQAPGQVTIRVKAKDDTTPIAQAMVIEARLLTRNGTALAASAWGSLTPNLTSASGNFPVTLPGRYTYEVRVIDDGFEDVFLHLAAGFDITQVVAGLTYALTMASPIDSSSTTLGYATGTLTPRFTGGPGVIDVELIQDMVTIRTASTAKNDLSTSVSSVVFSNLAAGDYTVTARLQDSSTPGPVTGNGIVEPPPLEIGDQLTFLPWVQPTLGNAALMNPSQNQGLRPTLDLSATLAINTGLPQYQTQPVAATQAEIYGPGDVLGINQRAILATVPVPDAVGFSPLQLAAIDFKEEDLPWRYSMLTAPAVAAFAATPTAAATAAIAAAPLPWCMLLVLRADEFEALPLAGQPLPSIKVKASATAATHVYPSPLPEQQKLWAHVQANASLGTPGTPASGTTAAVPYAPPTPTKINEFLNTTLARQPDLAYSRVLCPRRLEANTAYQAFLVPALEIGRLAGLGLPLDATHVRKSAIPDTPAATNTSFPVYFQWKFATGSEDDFESLVTQLHPANGATSAAIAPGLGVRIGTTDYVLPMPALLVDANAPLAPATAAAQELAVAQYLHTQLAPGRRVGSRPVVTPPLYGRAYMVTPNLLVPTVAVANSWKHTLNLDPRYRALAALGAQVVQDNQEEYVRRAWEQVQDILLANDKLRGAQYGLRTTTGLRDQHLPLEGVSSAGAGGTGSRVAAPVAAKGTSSRAAVTTAAAAPVANSGPGMADYGLHLTALALGRVRVSAATAATIVVVATAEANPLAPPPVEVRVTVREAIRRSSTPLAAFSPTFRRIMKPFGNYQVGEAGRALRPTQPDSAVVSGDLRQAGTSLAQRDAVLRQLVERQLTAAPERAQQVRVYQFLDDKVDVLLASGRPLQSPVLTGEAARLFSLAFEGFRTPDPNKPLSESAVHFDKPQYVRPALPLDAIKADVVVGTDPGPVFQVRIKQASPTVDVPPVVAVGDYDAPDFNANDFFVDEFGEPGAPVPGDWLAADFKASDFQVDDYPPATPAPAPAPSTFARGTLAATTPAAPAPAAGLPVIKQAKVTPVFKDPMGEALRLRHPELFVPGLGEFPAGGVALLDVNRAFMEAYMVGLNHALGSELLWRGFPVDVRGTFFQQFWDVREHFNTTLAPGQVPSAAEEASMLDIKPLDQWIGRALGSNAPDPTVVTPPGQPIPPARVANPLRMAVRSELLRRYPNLVLALQLKTETTADPALMLHPLQRLSVGQDMVVVTFDVDQATAELQRNLVLMERPGQPKFGLDETAPPADQPTTPQGPVSNPLSWNDFSWQYLGTLPGEVVTIAATGRPHATAEPREVAYLTDSATVAYALFQEPIMAAIPLSDLVD